MLNSILVDVFNSFWDVKLSGAKLYNKQITFIFLCLAPLIFPAINGHRLVFSGQSATKLAFNNKRTMHNELSLEFEREIVDTYGKLTISNSYFCFFFHGNHIMKNINKTPANAVFKRLSWTLQSPFEDWTPSWEYGIAHAISEIT